VLVAGYLCTGLGANTVFFDVPMVSMYMYGDLRCVLVAAGPEQAATWREREWKTAIPRRHLPR
jgi:hypothetical protein